MTKGFSIYFRCASWLMPFFWADSILPALTISSRSARILMAARNGWLVVVSSKSGPVAQLGARFHGMEEVVGSNPTRSTSFVIWLAPGS